MTLSKHPTLREWAPHCSFGSLTRETEPAPPPERICRRRKHIA